MSKTFKISAIAASLLVSGILVGCGSSNDGSSTPGPTPGPGPGPVAPKSITVTDDYVLGAKIFVVSDSKSRNSGNSTLGLGTPTVSVTTTEVGQGVYRISDVKPSDNIVSNKGFVDLNNNGKIDAGEPLALNMAGSGKYKYVNPFTTIELLTNADVKELFTIAKVDFDTSGHGESRANDELLKTRKAVAYANAILFEAQHNSAKYDPISPAPVENDNGSFLPKSYKSTLQKVVDQVKATMKTGKTLAEAIAILTGNNKYKNLNTVDEVNELIKQELSKQPGESTAIVPPSDSGSFLPK